MKQVVCLERELRSLFQSSFDTGLCSHASVAWSYGDESKIVNLGEAESGIEKEYDFGSITKGIIAIVISQLVEKGFISLDTLVAPILGLNGVFAENITLRHLLTYSVYFEHGFDTNKVGNRYSDFLGILQGANLREMPGTRFSYTNLAPVLLGIIAEKITGENLESLVQEFGFTFKPEEELCVPNYCTFSRGLIQGQVHDPMAHNAMRAGKFIGCAGLFGTIDRLLHFSKRLISGEYISQVGLEAMARNQFLTNPVQGAQQFGLGWDIPLGHYLAQESPFFPGCFQKTAYTGSYIFLSPNRDFVLCILRNITFRDPSYIDKHRKESSELRANVLNLVLNSLKSD